jgi:hypothetical protein
MNESLFKFAILTIEHGVFKKGFMTSGQRFTIPLDGKLTVAEG